MSARSDAVLDAPATSPRPRAACASPPGGLPSSIDAVGGVQPRPHPVRTARSGPPPTPATRTAPRPAAPAAAGSCRPSCRCDGELTALEEGRAPASAAAPPRRPRHPRRSGARRPRRRSRAPGTSRRLGRARGASVRVVRQTAQQHVAEQSVAAVPLPARVQRRRRTGRRGPARPGPPADPVRCSAASHSGPDSRSRTAARTSRSRWSGVSRSTTSADR